MPGHTAIVVGGAYDGYPWEDDHLELTTSESGDWGLLMWSGSDGESGIDGGAILTGQWACVEWEFNDEPDAINVWVDGVPIAAAAPEDLALMGQSSGLVGGFDTLQLGLRSWHSPDFAMELDIDDVAIDIDRIGCLP